MLGPLLRQTADVLAILKELAQKGPFSGFSWAPS